MMWHTLSGLSLLSLVSAFVSERGLRYDQGPARADSAQIPSVVLGKFIVEFQDSHSFRGREVGYKLVGWYTR